LEQEGIETDGLSNQDWIMARNGVVRANIFFQILFPAPVISGVEPAYIQSGSGGALYVTGRYFYEGDTISLGGSLITNVTVLSSGLIRGDLVSVVPQQAGTYAFELMTGRDETHTVFPGVTVQVDPPLYTTLQGPPLPSI